MSFTFAIAEFINQLPTLAKSVLNFHNQVNKSQDQSYGPPQSHQVREMFRKYSKRMHQRLGRHFDSKKLAVYSYISFIFLPVPKAQILLIHVIFRNMAPETQMAALVNKQ